MDIQILHAKLNEIGSFDMLDSKLLQLEIKIFNTQLSSEIAWNFLSERNIHFSKYSALTELIWTARQNLH